MSTVTSQLGVGLLIGQIVRVPLAIRSTHACQLPRAITFPTARSFVRPTASNKAAFADLITRLGIGGALNRLLITGHTDSAGGNTAAGRAANQALSERRTQAVNAVLRNDDVVWESLFNSEGWGTPELTEMVTEIGETDISPFRGPGNAAARTGPTGLYRRYFARLLAGATVPAITTTTPPLLGCGQEHLLRGSRAAPTRDDTQPPIEGEFEANRRVEFFFFDSSPSTIACSEYPTWTGICSLTPPPPPVITVTIAPLDTVGRGRTADVLVTINPSPLPFGSQVTLNLSTTAGTGEARFASNNGTTLNVTATGPVTIRGVTPSSGPDNIRLSATATGQTGVLAQEDFTVVDAISLFLQFEVWNLTTLRFEPLPAGINVDMNRDVGSGRVIRTERTAANGRVFFNLPDLTASGVPNPDVFFLVHTSGVTHAGHTIPRDWSTKGWLAADNTTPGLQISFTGPQLGTPAAPIVFRVGLDFHGRLRYHVDDGRRTGSDDPSPPQVPVKLMQEARGFDVELLSLLTNANGEFHGVSFIAEPGRVFYLHVDFEMQETAINLQRTRVTDSLFLTLSWDSKDVDADRSVAPTTNRTSFGVHTAPHDFRVTINSRNVALYQLKVLRELAVLLFEITGGTWPGVEIRVFPRAPAQAFSFPPGQLNIPATNQWQRRTILHEMAHQVMWRESNFGAGSITDLFVTGVLSGCHRSAFRANPTHAVIEGWADFVSFMFEPIPSFKFMTPTTDLTDASFTTGGCVFPSLGIPLGPGGGAPNNQGHSVEGAFAQGVLGVFDSEVVGPIPSAIRASEHDREQVLVDAPLVRDPAVRRRFNDMIWRPLQSLRPFAPVDKNTVRMIAAMRSINLADWHKIQPQLQAFNMAMDTPTVTGINPTGGPPGGGTPVTITGTEFTLGTTSVTFNGVPAPGVVNVTSTTTLTATTPPGPLGPADVVVTTPGGSSTAFRGFTYALVPTITSVLVTGTPPGTQARGPTSGQTPITISGANFQPGARVFLGGLPAAGGVEATDVIVGTTFEITAKTPLFPLPTHRPGGTAVVVLNPDGQSGDLTPGFDYFLGPAPNISLITPPQGLPAGNETIVIDGSNFDPAATVTIGGRGASIDVAQSTSTRLTVLTPPRPDILTRTTVNVEITNPDGQTGTGPFTYVPLPAPAVTLIVPANGTAAGGETVVIEGLNFQAGVTVTIDGRNAEVDRANTTSTRITVLTPARPGTTTPVVVNVEVKNPDNQTATGGFTYTP